VQLVEFLNNVKRLPTAHIIFLNTSHLVRDILFNNLDHFE
jgi:hypothetical protein